MEAKQPVIGFIGLGLMGTPMVKRLLAAKFKVLVWNRSPEKTRELVKAGAQAAASISQLTETAKVVMLCLTDTAAVETVVFGKGGVASMGCSDKVLVDFSSIAPLASKEFTNRLKDYCEMPWIDAPVSGGTAGAEAGTLIIMAGGDEQVLDSIRPVFEPLSQRLTHMGGPGSGQMTKLCNQMVVANNALVIAEMMALGRANGVDVAQLPQALAGGFADSIPFQILAPQMAEHDFTLKWKVATLLKDLGGAVTLAEKTDASLPMSQCGVDLLRRHADSGFADRDLSTLIGLYETIKEDQNTDNKDA